MSAGFRKLRTGGGGSAAAFLCECSSHDMPENLQYYNNANKSGDSAFFRDA